MDVPKYVRFEVLKVEDITKIGSTVSVGKCYEVFTMKVAILYLFLMIMGRIGLFTLVTLAGL